MIDLHCHILPGVDDGPATLQESLAMLRLAAADGVRTIVATPHLPPEAFSESPWIAEAVARLGEVCREEGLPLELLPGAEVPAVPEVLAHLERLPRLAGGEYLLLEPPLAGLPNYLEDIVFNLQLIGIKVILAHPERTQLLRAKPELFPRLAERGCLLQINATSLERRVDRGTRRLAAGLLRAHSECVLASDAHDALYRPPLLRRALGALRTLGGEARFRELTEEGPAAVVRR